MEIIVKNIGELETAAEEFLSNIGNRRHFAFDAEMGVGKTTFISTVARLAGSLDEASSPTFSIVNQYELSEDSRLKGGLIYHFDFYRIESDEEALDLGLDDYWDSGSLCLIEWAEKVEKFLPEDLVTVRMEERENGIRVISFE